MLYELKNLFANVRKENKYRPTVRSIAFLGMHGDGQQWYLQVRFCDFDAMDIEGDHLIFSLQEAMDYARMEYGVLESDWRLLRSDEVNAIPTFIAGKRVHRNND
jgi:hypothetical protein